MIGQHSDDHATPIGYSILLGDYSYRSDADRCERKSSDDAETDRRDYLPRHRVDDADRGQT